LTFYCFLHPFFPCTDLSTFSRKQRKNETKQTHFFPQKKVPTSSLNWNEKKKNCELKNKNKTNVWQKLFTPNEKLKKEEAFYKQTFMSLLGRKNVVKKKNKSELILCGEFMNVDL
jgi:exonuclease III